MNIGRFFAILSRLRPRHIPFAPLGLTLALTELAFRLPIGQRKMASAQGLDWGHGVSVVIPERGGGELLAQCLDHLAAALADLDEPAEVIVVVNGSPLEDYTALQSTYPDVRWMHSTGALGFTSAASRGVAAARYGAIYLLNNDMLLEPDALGAALAWRGPHVFAVASQIFFQDSTRRREETGWTSMTIVDALPVPWHETPLDDTVRGTVWAGAGSSLFHAGMLRELLADSSPFDPFYWEDVDLGVRAWRQGYESLFCPASVAWHKHRATVVRYFEATEVERIFERNRLLFQLRNPFPRQPLRSTLGHIAQVDQTTRIELGSWRSCARLWRARWRAFRAPYRDIDYAAMSTKIHHPPAKPKVVLVSPFVVLPPAHGGAVRTQRLAAELRKDFDVILLSDERDLYVETSAAWFSQFSSVHLVRQTRVEPDGTIGRIARIRSHSHQALKDELTGIVETNQPAAVLIEHMELGALVEITPAQRPPFILSLQDVLICPDDPSQRAADQFELSLVDRFDGIVVCSAEDQALLGSRKSRLVANGVDLALARGYVSSRGKRGILFMGPFRAPNNWDGIREFLEHVYPEVEAAVPGVTITVLGGSEAQRMAAAYACFARPSIQILEYVESVRSMLDACALTINPQSELRGSSLKVIESLAAGRVCVSTRIGARGRLEPGFRGLALVDRVQDFAAPLIRLLNDDDYRVALEAPETQNLATCSWQAAGRVLRAYVREIVARQAMNVASVIAASPASTSLVQSNDNLNGP